jgi:uncharacterized integral membrane protein
MEMSRAFGIVTVVLVVLVAMGFAAANAGHRVTLSLGFFTLYHVPVTLVAFSGLFVGMLVMFATGIHSDLKVRRILRDRLAEEARQEQTWIDRNQQDLFAEGPRPDSDAEEPPAGGPPEDQVPDETLSTEPESIE